LLLGQKVVVDDRLTGFRQGFTWLEEKWHVDLSGQSAAAVDADGWVYAVDFPWLRMPPLPGMGRK
jgi:hypothetical protein